MGSVAWEAAADWACYGQHAAVIVSGGPAPDVRWSGASFAACAGAPYVDVNQVALLDAIGPDEVRSVVATIVARDLPAVLARTSATTDTVLTPLRAAGFAPWPDRELLFAMDGVPEETVTRFDVRPIATPADIAALIPIAEEVHGYDPELTRRLLAAPARAGDPVTGWLAWDGDVAMSCAFVTRVGATLGMWGVMTPAAHRRKGAGGAVVRGALRGAALRAGGAGTPIARTVFWASPTGGPFYRSLGFQPVDEFEVWVREVARPEGFEPPTL